MRAPARVVGVVIGVLSLWSSSASASTITIDTFPNWGGTGFGFNGSIGQTISTPVAAVLDSFTFFLEDELTPLSVQAYILPWNNFFAIPDPLLYQSSVFTTTNNAGHGGMEKFTFAPNILLNAGQEYVVFLSGPSQVGGVPSELLLAFVGQDVYSGGHGTANAPFELLSTNSWGSFGNPDVDFAFQAELTEVPEPASLVLLAMGLLYTRVGRFRNGRG